MLNLFISWSGQRSRQAAEVLAKHVRVHLTGTTPFISTGILSGQRWFDQIAAKLEVANFGILCVTKANFQSPWLHFEAGALAKHHREANVCLFLLDLKPTDLLHPLADYQATEFSRSDVQKLFWTINDRLGEQKRNDTDFGEMFETVWPKLAVELQSVIDTDDGAETTSPGRTPDSFLDEVLANTRELLVRIPSIPELPEGMTAFEYIPGETKAMQALIEGTKRAKRHIRATRFFPHAIINTFPEYATAIADRVLGKGCQPLEHYFRIVAANNIDKLKDVEDYLQRFQGQPFTLYLTSFTNDFELVVIDDTEVFIHFYGHELVIESTLRLEGPEIAQRFERIFSRLHDKRRGPVEKFECRYSTRDNLDSFLDRARKFFAMHLKRKAEVSSGATPTTDQESGNLNGGVSVGT